MKEQKELKELYSAPEVEIVRLASPISLLETFSGGGSVGDYGNGGEWGLDPNKEPEDWFANPENWQ